ncbi:dynamin GTPase, putative [Aspergillus lentulus]|nr:dynamin GTPase, putative [Aspergillus lentulus]
MDFVLNLLPKSAFATTQIIIEISRTEEEKARLGAFCHKVTDLADLPSIINEAARLVGVQGVNSLANTLNFAANVLHLEIIGDTGLHLTLVDLPGLISVSKNKDNVQLVGDLMNLYLENSQSIILAIVPASSNMDTQSIIQCAYYFNKDGIRTVRIITKPNLINDGTEGCITRLANNTDRIKLKLGFFLIKNP